MTHCTTNDIFFSSIADKRQLGKRLFDAHGTELLQQELIQESLGNLQALSQQLHSSMERLVMFSLCSQCGSKPGGGCCSAFMAGETDAVQILMNLLLDREVKTQRQDDVECCYLGPQGCIFTLKPFFCLNYNCQQILTGNEPKALQSYLAATGRLLQEQARLEEITLSFLKRKGVLIS